MSRLSSECGLRVRRGPQLTGPSALPPHFPKCLHIEEASRVVWGWGRGATEPRQSIMRSRALAWGHLIFPSPPGTLQLTAPQSNRNPHNPRHRQARRKRRPPRVDRRTPPGGATAQASSPPRQPLAAASDRPSHRASDARWVEELVVECCGCLLGCECRSTARPNRLNPVLLVSRSIGAAPPIHMGYPIDTPKPHPLLSVAARRMIDRSFTHSIPPPHATPGLSREP